MPQCFSAQRDCSTVDILYSGNNGYVLFVFSSQSEGNSMAPGQVPEMDTHWVETTDKKAAMRVSLYKLLLMKICC